MIRIRGFTLIELVMVIVILGIVSLGTFSFISDSTRIFSDATNRDQLLSSSRFVLERLTREVRGAIPNSFRVINSNNAYTCLEFVPVAASGNYIDVPVAPEAAATTAELIRGSSGLGSCSDGGCKLSVYPLNTADIYSSTSTKSYAVSLANNTTADVNNDILTATFAGGTKQFALDSPARRYYLFENAVSYCVEGAGARSIFRYSGYSPTTNQPAPSISHVMTVGGTPISGVLMAENLVNQYTAQQIPFVVQQPTLLQNGLVNLFFLFQTDDEPLNLNSEVHIPNVP